MSYSPHKFSDILSEILFKLQEYCYFITNKTGKVIRQIINLPVSDLKVAIKYVPLSNVNM